MQQQQQPQQQPQQQQQQQYAQNDEPDATRNLIVNYIPVDLTESHVSAIFEPFGDIESIKIIIDRNTGQSRGYGFVKYKHSASAQQAIAQLNGYEVGTKRLKVGLASEGNQRRGGGQNQGGYPSPYGGMPGGFYPMAPQRYPPQQMAGQPFQGQPGPGGRGPNPYMGVPPGMSVPGYGGYPPAGYPPQS